MKKIFLPIIFLFALSTFYLLPSTLSVHAATATPSGSTTPDPKQQQIDDLKERLATKVAELRKSQKRAIYGTVKATSVSTITVETKTSDMKIELIDEIKVFQIIKGERTELSTDDIAKDDIVVVFGDYDSNLDLLKAKVIFIQSTPAIRINGTVSEIDKKNFTITVSTTEGQSYVVDIETLTKNFSWTTSGGIAKGAFSKIALGDTVFVLGTTVAKKDNQLSAVRILDLGNLSGVAPTPTPTPEASPSATLKTTPKTTPKPTATPTP